MERKPLYRIVLTCWDHEEKSPFCDRVANLFDSKESAQKALRSCVKDELEALNGRDIEDIDLEYPSEFDRFKVIFDGDEFDAIIQFWDGDDYWPVTGYKIHEILPLAMQSWMYRENPYYLLKKCEQALGFNLYPSEKKEYFDVYNETEKTSLCREHTFVAALDFIDDYALQLENKARQLLLEKRNTNKNEDREWLLPVTWEVSGFVKVKGETLSESIDSFNRDIDRIRLPKESTYVEGSFGLSCNEEEYIASFNN